MKIVAVLLVTRAASKVIALSRSDQGIWLARPASSWLRCSHEVGHVRESTSDGRRGTCRQIHDNAAAVKTEAI